MPATVVRSPIRAAEFVGRDGEVRWKLRSGDVCVLTHAYQIAILHGYLLRFQRRYSDRRLSLDHDPYALDRLEFQEELRREKSLPWYFACGCDESLWQVPLLGQRFSTKDWKDPRTAGLIEVFLLQGHPGEEEVREIIRALETGLCKKVERR